MKERGREQGAVNCWKRRRSAAHSDVISRERRFIAGLLARRTHEDWRTVRPCEISHRSVPDSD